MIAKKISKIMSQSTTRVKSVDFHPVKPIFIIGLHDGRIQAWDYNSNACIHEFLDHESSVRSVCFHPHGDFFVSGGDDKKIRMWDYTKRKLLKVFKGHTDFVRSINFHPSKTWIISSSDDQSIRIWNFMTGKCLAQATGHSHYVMSAKFLDDTTIISGSLDNSIRIWDCKNLIEIDKKSKFVPNIIVKQIVQGHDRGINFISVCKKEEEDTENLVIISGGDDREVKIWEYRNELVEKESYFAHQGCVTNAILYQNYVISVGEDGLFCIFDLKTHKYNKFFVEGRFWALSGKNGNFVCGHDNGFEILEYAEPKLLCKSEKGCFYLKKTHFYFSDLKSERRVCKAEGDVISLHSVHNYLLIQYSNKFEIYEKNNKLYRDEGKAVLLYKNELLIATKKGKDLRIRNLQSEEVNAFEVIDGELLFGDSRNFFVSKNGVLVRFSSDGFVDTLNVGYTVDKVISNESLYAFISKNKISLFDSEFNLVNHQNEIVNICDGFFHNDIFIYATTKHLKYLFSEEGVIISVDTKIYPFCYDQNLIYYLSDDGIESVEVNLTEIEFKKLVLDNQDITSIIESGSLPGLSPLSFLIKNKKGDIALPYIKNKKQRFELCLSTKRLEECIKYCEDEDDHHMYEKLSNVALEEGNFEIAEKCLLHLNEWYDLFLLYLCSNRVDKMKTLLDTCDEYTEKIVRLYLEDTEYFFKDENLNKKSGSVISNDKDVKGEVSKANDKDVKAKQEKNKSDIKSKLKKKGTKVNNSNSEDIINIDNLKINDISLFLDKDKLKDLEYEEVEIDTSYDEGLENVTKGNFIKALDIFKNILYTIGNTCDSKEYLEDKRKVLGAYISGLMTQILRKKEDDGYRQLVYASYFSTLDLQAEHKTLAKQELINVCLRNGNHLQAKELAESYPESENIPKVVKKALRIEDPENRYNLPKGVFCYDVKDYKMKSKSCMFCFVKSYKGEMCTLCGIGYLSK
ncbi:hypothetical protein P3W45_001527 [Vairimorpha bombi]|jgi:coatomer subunit alpha